MPSRAKVGGQVRATPGRVAIGYARISTHEQEANGTSLAAQETAIRAECEHRDWQLLRVESDVLSGRNMKRPGLQRALADCRSGAAAAIVAARIDRISRSVIDFASLLQDAQKRGYNVVVMDFGLDLSTRQGKLVANVLMSVAEWERDVMSARTREALAVVKARGPRPGKLPPGRPVVLASELRTRLRRMRGRGLSYREIAARLNAEGVATAHGGMQWWAATVRNVTG